MILRASGLRKRYGDEAGVDAVIRADLTVGKGEFVAIVGRSGSGKSTLLAMIGALTAPSEGQIILAGQDIWQLPETELADVRRQRIGFVFQFSSLLSNLKAVDNVALPALLGRSVAPAHAYARAQTLLERVGLHDRMFAFPGQMSGGEQRRTVIARALINRPSVLLADEPTSDLDEDTEGEIIALLEVLRHEEEFGMIVVTHNLDLARRADRLFQMRLGALCASDEPLTPILSPPRRADPPKAKILQEIVSSSEGARVFGKLGETLWAAAGRASAIAALVFALVLSVNYGLARYQRNQVEVRRERFAALEELATSTLRSEIASISRLGDGHYEVTIYLENTKGDQPIYVMSPTVQGFVQTGADWQEVPLIRSRMRPPPF